ncbi:protein phosphatase 1 regulatory subunit 36 [Plutella xylostella]|nr:protein phosphatase 1 regulatory subunit 36 [Plutella xylostella]
MADEEDDEDLGFGGLYQDGHWEWDERENEIVFISDLPPALVEVVRVPVKPPTGTIEFRDDVDVLEQIRFRRRYQRKLKPGQPDIITLQDIKDIALFTAPLSILNPQLIDILHTATCERFLRALLLYCQYYLQIAEVMSQRVLELETKVRTPECDVIERQYRDNLADLKLVVAKEYSTGIIGGDDTTMFHHMGPEKKRRSLSDKDARLCETLLRICVHIIWLALGRKSFNQIELELHRLFKSETFNCVEHAINSGYLAKMTREERRVLIGQCVRKDKKLHICSPLINEVFCDRRIDYRLLGLGVIEYPELPARLQYIYQAVAGPESDIRESGVSLGIVGHPRANFDTMLHPLVVPAAKSKSRVMSQSLQSNLDQSKISTKSSTTTGSTKKIYEDIILPHVEDEEPEFPPEFPHTPLPPRRCSETQRRRWQRRLRRLLRAGAPRTHSHVTK